MSLHARIATAQAYAPRVVLFVCFAVAALLLISAFVAPQALGADHLLNIGHSFGASHAAAAVVHIKPLDQGCSSAQTGC